MTTTQLPEYLQFHGQSRDTGRLVVQTPLKTGFVYLLDGDVVYAESQPTVGMLALFSALSWADATVRWEPRQVAPKVQFHISVDELLFQFAQLEDSGQTDEASLTSLFSANDPQEGVRMMDLSQYAVSFEVLNTTFKGFEFVLEKENTLIGRLEDCDVILPEGSVSGHHCRIVLDAHCVRVVDLGSTNGTFIKGELISEHLLQVGDDFQIGAISLALHLRMRRKINAESAAPASVQPSPAMLKNLQPLPDFHTQKLDPKLLRKRTSKMSGPITWKNLVEDTKKKTGSNSLFSKMFGKK